MKRQDFPAVVFACGVIVILLSVLGVGAYRAIRDLLGVTPAPVSAQGIPFTCPFSAPIALTLAGNTQIVAAPAGAIFICHISFSTTAAEDVQIRQGSGGCGGATTAVSGVYKSVQSVALDFQTSPLRFGTASAACLNQAAGQILGGVVEWGNLF